MLYFSQTVVEVGHHSNPMECMIGKSPLQTEETPLDSLHGNMCAHKKSCIFRTPGKLEYLADYALLHPWMFEASLTVAVLNCNF